MSRFEELEVDLTPEEIAAWHARKAARATAPVVAEEAPASPALPLPAIVAAIVVAAPAPAGVAFPAYRPLVGEYKTAHGATGSPRMHRCYRWCSDHKLGISDWSTDTGVASVLPKLEQLVKAEEAHLLDLDMGSPEATFQAELITDIRGLMNRVPENRSVAAQQDKALVQAKFRDGLIAVSQSSDVTGGVIYWQLTGEVSRADLVAAFVANGLDEDDAPALATPEVALGRAVKELQGRSVLIRKLKVGGWAVVCESEVNGELQHQQIVRVFLQGEKDNETIQHVAAPGCEQQAAIEVARIVAEYDKVRAALSVVDLSSWLVKTANKLDGVPLRDRGGIYFIPRANIETLRKVKASLAAAKSGCIVHEIPAMHSSEAITAIYDAVGRDASVFISDIEAELNAGIGSRAAKNRVTEVEAFLKKVRNYEGLLGQKFTATAETLAKLVVRLNKATTRASQLEID